MKQTRRMLLRSALAFPALSLAMPQEHGAKPAMTANAAMKSLMEGNKRFVAGRSKHPRRTPARIRETAAGQHPFAAILSCSDSRVPPELFFDQGIGDLFVVRVAGNVANNDEVASLAYAIEHFGSPLCVVIGHTECGAVKAVVNGEKVSADIARMVASIGTAHSATKKSSPSAAGKDLLSQTVRANVKQSSEEMLRASELISGKVRAGALRIAGAVYDINTGKVEWLA